jgi:parallel beta-helix repeat protein
MRFFIRATGPLVLVAIILSVAVSHAATYYVSTSGNDANPGTSGSPWRTLQKAANTVRAGDLVLVANGTYAGFQVTADGTSAQPIVFRANGGSVVVNARNASTPDNINIEGGNYVTVEGFIVNDAPRVGIRAVTATGVVIRNNKISRSGLDGILTGYTPQIQIIDNIASGSQEEHGIYVSNSTSPNDNPVVRGNECFDNNQNGMQFNGDCDAGGDGIISGAVIEDNIIHDNNWKGFSMISLQNSTIRNNLVYQNGILAGAGGIHLADQPGCGKPSNNNIVANNTIHEPRIAGIRITNGSAGNVIFNNMVVSSNAIVDESGGNFIDPVSNIKRTSVNGVFVDANAGNYSLLPESPAVDHAVFTYHGVAAPTIDMEGVTRPQGLLDDAGAYEHALATGIDETPTLDVVLEQNAPNPFGTSTRIAFALPAGAQERVAMAVYDARGRRVRELVRERVATGRVTVDWDGRNESGQAVASGVYFYRLSVGSQIMTRRMTLVR